jgi:hypothetical protein
VGRAYVARSNATRALRALFLCGVFASSPAAWGCVETAECDASSPCRGGDQICYDYRCVTPCGGAQECGEEQECVPCAEAQLCVGDEGAVCVDQEQARASWAR